MGVICVIGNKYFKENSCSLSVFGSIDVMAYCRNQVVVSNFQCRITQIGKLLKLRNNVGPLFRIFLFQISVAKARSGRGKFVLG